MRTDAIPLEEGRLDQVEDIKDYHNIKERHRVFPDIFEERNHQNILELASGVGITAKRIANNYPARLTCSEISPTALKLLHKLGIPLASFDLDDPEVDFPFRDETFDAVISMVTIEHILAVDHFMHEINRVMSENAYLYISTPNYAAPEYLFTMIRSGRTFHDPLWGTSRYEFYAHVRYFTYVTLKEYVSSFGFALEAVYLPLPASSTRYQALLRQSKAKALAYRSVRWFLFHTGSPRWAAEPILCFQKSKEKKSKVRKVVV